MICMVRTVAFECGLTADKDKLMEAKSVMVEIAEAYQAGSIQVGGLYDERDRLVKVRTGIDTPAKAKPKMKTSPKETKKKAPTKKAGTKTAEEQPRPRVPEVEPLADAAELAPASKKRKVIAKRPAAAPADALTAGAAEDSEAEEMQVRCHRSARRRALD